MDIEFHYYMTYLIALRVGLKRRDAFTVAYSSQFTDDNDYQYTIRGEDGTYRHLITQTSDITKPQEERLNIYPIFHFCPGTLKETGQAPSRTDGKHHPLNTIAGNSNAGKIFADSVNSGNLYRIGIAAHMYADTFCHRDFVGYKDDFNWLRIEGLIEGLLDDILPCIGHALALHQPDIPALVWKDKRLSDANKEKKNKEQILSAAAEVFDFLCTFTKPNGVVSIRRRLLGDLGEAMGGEAESDSETRRSGRIRNYRTLLGPDYREYDDAEWFNEAVRQEIDPGDLTSDIKYNYFWKENHKFSDWYAFQEAAKEHKTRALAILNENFAAVGLNSAGDW